MCGATEDGLANVVVFIISPTTPTTFTMFFKLLYTTALPLTEVHRDKNWVIEKLRQARLAYLVPTSINGDSHMFELSTGLISN